jgi:predicted negative regulator of RcsB-dependent stress response
MTSTQPESAAADRAQTFVDWTRINGRALTAGAAIVVIAAAGYWFFMRSKQIQAANAEKALMQAKQSMSAGNPALAQSDLQKIYTRYGSTGAGVEAAMILAQLDFDTGKFQDGISRLEKVSGSSAASNNEPTIKSLEGDGYAQMGKMADAAKAYQSAADASVFENEKAFNSSKAARAFQAAGDTAKARAIWTALLNDPQGQTMAAEAKVRLGEMSARSAKP